MWCSSWAHRSSGYPSSARELSLSPRNLSLCLQIRRLFVTNSGAAMHDLTCCTWLEVSLGLRSWLGERNQCSAALCRMHDSMPRFVCVTQTGCHRRQRRTWDITQRIFTERAVAACGVSSIVDSYLQYPKPYIARCVMVPACLAAQRTEKIWNTRAPWEAPT